MSFLLLLIFSALAVSAVAAWFSIVGLMAIFPAAAVAILSMGVVLEIAKLVTASWLYKNWDTAGVLLKTYFTSAVVILSIITSMGIFGFLSKAHLEQTISQGGTNVLQIQNLERQIQNEERLITDGETLLSQLDDTVATLIEYDRIRGIKTKNQQVFHLYQKDIYKNSILEIFYILFLSIYKLDENYHLLHLLG